MDLLLPRLDWNQPTTSRFQKIRLRRLVLAVTVLNLLAAPGLGQSLHQTHSGRVEPGFINRYAFTPPAPGQLLATLSWDSNSAQLLLILVCTVEGEELPYGVASGLLDRFARLEAGVLPNSPCEIGVMTATSSANYTLNLQRSQPESSSAQPPEAVPARRSMVRTAVLGTSRGAAIERIAFRLQLALNP